MCGVVKLGTPLYGTQGSGALCVGNQPIEGQHIVDFTWYKATIILPT